MGGAWENERFNYGPKLQQLNWVSDMGHDMMGVGAKDLANMGVDMATVGAQDVKKHFVGLQNLNWMSDMGYDLAKVGANDVMQHYSGLQQLNMEDSRL